MFSQEEILKLKIFCQTITRSPRSLDQQPNTRQNGKSFCDDWEIIEIIKFLFNGELYWGDPLPNRLKNNPLFLGKQDIANKANKLIQELNSVDAIIEHLKQRRKT